MSKKKEVEAKKKKEETFFSRMKNDSKYSAKIQLMGYGLLIMLVIIYLNVSGTSSGLVDGNNIGNLDDNKVVDNNSYSKTNLLNNLGNNYSYDIIIDIKKKGQDTKTLEEIEVTDSINYNGKSFNKKLEINKRFNNLTSIYYKVDEEYYVKNDNVITNTTDTIVYDNYDKQYIEIKSILDLINKASLDHVTDYSSGKKEYVYHLKVKDIILGHLEEDYIEIKIVEENKVINIDIDYSNLFKVNDKNILEYKLKGVISKIGEVEDFEVVVNDITNN